MKRGINMTMAEVDRYNARHGFAGASPVAVEAARTAPKSLRGSRQPNKTEAEFGLILEARKRNGKFGSVTFEAVKLRIAGNCYYAPDYMAVWTSGTPHPFSGEHQHSVTFFEVKGGGPIRDDSMVKFKACRELHKWASFEMWRKTKEGWRQLL